METSIAEANTIPKAPLPFLLKKEAMEATRKRVVINDKAHNTNEVVVRILWFPFSGNPTEKR
jgi:hypothetical protein